MNQDETYRTILIALFLIFLPIGMFFRIKSQMTGESLDRRQEGLFILATLRPMGLALALGLIAYMIDPSWMAWSSVPLPGWLRSVGVGAWLVACAFLFWTFNTLGPNLTDTVVTRKRHTLVMHGPYRFVRHPFYDFVALLTVASALVTANWFVLLAGGLVFVLMVVRTRTEEAKLLERFGDEYRVYMANTGRFVPRSQTGTPTGGDRTVSRTGQ
jgi:protein-S-isoprenylcysteine O-methyltransferase Ste14